MTSQKLTQIMLWFFVLCAFILTGGNLFDNCVLIPMWAGMSPQSVIAWSYGGAQGRFFIPVALVYALASVLLLIFSWRMPVPARMWARVASVGGLLILVWSGAFFIPILIKTEVSRGAGLSAQEIVTLTNRFVVWNWIRFFVELGDGMAGLMALTQFASEAPRSLSTSPNQK